MVTQVDNVLGDGIGSVELMSWHGGDLATVNGARVSYGKEKVELDDRDAKLITYLGEHIHQTPFRHTYFTLRIVVPMFVKMQWKTHMVGTEWGRYPDMPWSAFSARYSNVEPRFYVPATTRGQDAKNKQASAAPVDDQSHMFEHANRYAYATYQNMLADGVAREQARLVLPMSTYTEEVWTASLQALVHFAVLRDHAGAQEEIRLYARAVRSLCHDLAPVSWDALEAAHPLVLSGKLAESQAKCANLIERIARIGPY